MELEKLGARPWEAEEELGPVGGVGGDNAGERREPHMAVRHGAPQCRADQGVREVIQLAPGDLAQHPLQRPEVVGLDE